MDAAIAETHVSVIVFIGDRAYQLKKPVSFGFLNFSTRAAREEACRREVALNRRIAPLDYLGVADITGPDGALCDHVVVMRRMPDERRLSRMVLRGSNVEPCLRSVARTIAAFHARAERSVEISSAATRDEVLANWESNFKEMAPFAGRVLPSATVEDVKSLARRYLAGRSSLFDERIARGYVCDGHAHVRSKVACLRHSQGDAGSAQEAVSLLEMSAWHLRRGRVKLVLVGGPPGTGKSTLAVGIADARGWTVLRSDEVRKDLAGIPHTTPAPAAFGEGIYDAEMTERTYRELLARARRLLERGEPVILDATWTARGAREAAAVLARETSSDLVQLRCDVPPGVASSRLAARRTGEVSDATPDILEMIARDADPWPSATVIDTGGDAEKALDRALGVL